MNFLKFENFDAACFSMVCFSFCVCFFLFVNFFFSHFKKINKKGEDFICINKVDDDDFRAQYRRIKIETKKGLMRSFSHRYPSLYSPWAWVRPLAWPLLACPRRESKWPP